jgi:hypothetical protein
MTNPIYEKQAGGPITEHVSWRSSDCTPPLAALSVFAFVHLEVCMETSSARTLLRSLRRAVRGDIPSDVDSGAVFIKDERIQVGIFKMNRVAIGMTSPEGLGEITGTGRSLNGVSVLRWSSSMIESSATIADDRQGSLLVEEVREEHSHGGARGRTLSRKSGPMTQ